YVLGNDVNLEIFFEFGENSMPGIGFDFAQLAAALVVEIENQLWVGIPALRRGDGHDVVAFPQTVLVTEGFNPRFGRNAGAGQDNEFFHFLKIASSGSN